MDVLSVNLEHCFGIESLNYEFDFTKGNVFAVYARNGLMKTSFAKVFKKLQMSKSKEIRDEIFGIDGNAEVKCDGMDIAPENIFVIKSFENSYQADITSLLINEDIKTRLKDVLKARDKFLKALEKDSELKIKKTSSGKTVFELEPTIILDFGFEESSLLVNVLSFRGQAPEVDFSSIPYQRIFDAGVIRKINSAEFQSKIRDYISRSEEIYSSYAFLSKGNLTLPKLKNVHKSLKNEKYFSQGNKIFLAESGNIENIDELSAKIEEVEGHLRTVPEFQEIEKLLSDAKGTQLRDIIEVNPDIVEWLTIERLPELKKCLWLSYIQKNSILYEDLCDKYETLSREIDNVDLDDTPWKKALEIYDKRFSVPYKMEIENLKGAIIGESIPRVVFSFTNGKDMKKLSRDELDDLDVLSQGEKRALYLLNIIFEIEKIKNSGCEALFIVDDIADSFDYKNKYAIVEYLYEIAQNDKYSMIVLSHNFDFYRTISSRLGLKRENRLCANIKDGSVCFVQEFYQNQPFIQWKKHPNEQNIIAMIPFVRNLVEYGRDMHVAVPGDDETNNDYSLLTTLLHEKAETNNMRFLDLNELYSTYLGIDRFETSVDLNKKIMDTLYEICDAITIEHSELENKVLLSMAIRHKAEAFMKKEIREYTGQITWRVNRRTNNTGTSNQFLLAIESKANQTRELLNGYKQFGENAKIGTIEEVAIMTPENIHLNSFMYEPIMDMDIAELISLYRQCKMLN
ncbi:MAG: hypothetical protein IJJ40_05880 [Clostridia bacterium]|nr:hypothetical protein [Clostridia bacterium]